MFTKKLDVNKMSVAEMEALCSKAVKRILWLNGLWLVFVVLMLFWKTAIGVLLLVITVIKYYFDYHDVNSQAVAADFLAEAAKKTYWRRFGKLIVCNWPEADSRLD